MSIRNLKVVQIDRECGNPIIVKEVPSLTNEYETIVEEFCIIINTREGHYTEDIKLTQAELKELVSVLKDFIL